MDLLIDDVRDFNVDVIARNGKAGLKMLAFGGWDTVYFDHDLGGDINGFEVLSHALLHGWLDSAKVKLVTSNPVGRDRMINALTDNGFTVKHPNPYEQYYSKGD